MQEWRIHHFTNCSSVWRLLLLQCFAFFDLTVSSLTSQPMDFFFIHLPARLGSIAKTPFPIQLLTEQLSLLVALPFLAKPRCLPQVGSYTLSYLKATGDPGRRPQPSCSSRHHQSTAASAPKRQTRVTSRKLCWAPFRSCYSVPQRACGNLSILTLGRFPASCRLWLNH